MTESHSYNSDYNQSKDSKRVEKEEKFYEDSFRKSFGGASDLTPSK